MKLVKMSLAAAILMGASAFAVENTKISGDAQLVYQTVDANGNDLFGKSGATADAGIHLNATTDLVSNVSAGASFTALSTLGLENNLVSGVWGNSHNIKAQSGSDLTVKVENASWFNEAWLAYTAGKTTAKIGRMNLDTPLAFTETWSIEANSFEAAVVINQDIPDTTLIGAYIGNGNGGEAFGTAEPSAGVASGGIVNQNGNFATYGVNGAYTAGLVNNSWAPLTVQAWYYDLNRMAQAYWIQADLAMDMGLLVGAQYSGIDATDLAGTNTTSDVFAVMAGYEMKDTFLVKASYSVVGKDFGAGFNTATNIATAQSKLYTEAWWNYGYITRADTKSMNVTAEGNIAGMLDAGLYYTSADVGAANQDMSEITLALNKSFGPLDASLLYINTDADDQNAGDAYSNVQVYLTLNY